MGIASGLHSTCEHMKETVPLPASSGTSKKVTLFAALCKLSAQQILSKDP